MPVLVERQRISKRKILFLRPYILWRRSRDLAAEKQILSDIRREEEEKERAIERQRKEKEDKKREELKRKLDEAKELQSELTATRIQREQVEEKLKVLHEEKHRLFICLKTILAQKDSQRKTKQAKEQLQPPPGSVPGLTFSPSSITGKYSVETFQRAKPDQGFFQGSPLKRPHSPPPSGISFPYLEQTPPQQTPYSSLQQFYGRAGPPSHTEQPYGDLQGNNRPDYGSHQRLSLQRQEYSRPWQQASHKSPSATERRSHSSRPTYPPQMQNYPAVNYSYMKTSGQQRKSGSKH